MYLYGFTTLQDQATHLTSAISDSTLTLPVAESATISRGIAEIDDELFYINSVDTAGLTATVPPYGRGYRGTVAATHASGTRVVSSPLFPRVTVKRAMNEAIIALFPDLFGVASTTFTYTNGTYTYPLPAGAKSILQIDWQDSTTATEWIRIKRWDMDQNANTAVFPTGASVTISEFVVPGRTVRVLYAKVPTALVNPSDDFVTVTGLPQSCEDVVRWGTAMRMIPFFDSPHISGSSAEADFAANMRPVGSASTLGKYLLQNYQIRLREEVAKLQSLYPVRVHYTN
jgi:hypothetical protein